MNATKKMIAGLGALALLLLVANTTVNAQTCMFVNPGDIAVELAGGHVGTFDVAVDYTPAGSTTPTQYTCFGMLVNTEMGIPAGATINAIFVDGGSGMHQAPGLPLPICYPAATSGVCGPGQMEIMWDPQPGGLIHTVHVN